MAEFGLAIVSAVEVCLKYGEILVQKYSAYKHADAEITEMVLCIENRWIKTEQQLKQLRTLSNDLGDDLCTHQNAVLQILQGKLAEGIAIVDGVTRQKNHQPAPKSAATKLGMVKKFKYATRLKDCLEKTIYEIDKWHGLFDPSWLLLLRLSNPVIAQQTREHLSDKPNDLLSEIRDLQITLLANSNNQEPTTPVFIEDDTLIVMASIKRAIPLSSALEIQSESGVTLIVDENCKSTDRDARNFARILMCPGMDKYGLLTCTGVLRPTLRNQLPGLRFLFQVPSGLSKPMTLRQLLFDSMENPLACSLNNRLRIGLSLAKAVLFFHGSNFVHKGIRPEAILVFESNKDESFESFLLGFANFRLDVGKTYMHGDESWSMNMYRHPKRQGLNPEAEYTICHDIYSLGVNLLEIGLWQSFAVPMSATETNQNLLPAPFLAIDEFLKLKDNRAKAFAIKRRFLEIAKQQLPIKIGNKYANIVLDCLTCLDPDNSRFGDQAEFEDEDGIAVGVRYIDRILKALTEINV